jgi:prevent-host-death family protein
MKLVDIDQAKIKFSALLTEVEQTGEEVLICSHGKPIADLVPHRKRRRLEPHPIMRQMRFDYDPTEPLAENEWPEWA